VRESLLQSCCGAYCLVSGGLEGGEARKRDKRGLSGVVDGLLDVQRRREVD